MKNQQSHLKKNKTQPNDISQIKFKINPIGPDIPVTRFIPFPSSSLIWTTSFPNGNADIFAISNPALVKGKPIIDKAKNNEPISHANARYQPPDINQRILPKERMFYILAKVRFQIFIF